MAVELAEKPQHLQHDRGSMRIRTLSDWRSTLELFWVREADARVLGAERLHLLHVTALNGGEKSPQDRDVRLTGGSETRLRGLHMGTGAVQELPHGRRFTPPLERDRRRPAERTRPSGRASRQGS